MSVTTLSDAALNTAGRLLSTTVGLRLDPSIQARLARCIADDATSHRMDADAYVASLDREPALLQTLLDRVTVQETSFFRDPNQFAALRDTVLAERTSPVTIWSAGCANGQEAYSLAMTLAGAGCEEWSITASDISGRALGRARRGRYSNRELHGVSTADRARFFEAVDGEWQVSDELRDRVDVVRHNLVADPPPLYSDTCDIVFCRNVLIYFRHDDVVAFLHRLASWLRPGSWLFLGYSESMWHVSDAFDLVRLGDAFAYRRRPLGGNGTPTVRSVRPIRVPDRKPQGAPHRARARDRRLVIAPHPPTPRGVGTAELAAAGETALHRHDYPAAIAAFRKCAFLEPDQPLSHLHLALALEAGGHLASARRAYGAARRALDRSGTATVEAALEGYEPLELLRLLDAKLESVS